MRHRPSFRVLEVVFGIASLSSLLLSQAALAQQTPYTEQAKLIRAPQAVTTLGTDLFGDKSTCTPAA